MRAAATRRRVGRLLGVASVAVAVAAVGTAAALATEREARAAGESFGPAFSASVDSALVPANDLHVGQPTGVGPRQLGGTLRLPSTTFYAGAGVGFGLLSKHFVMPLFAFDMYSAAGLYDEQRSSLDGSITHLRPWTGNLYDFGFGGFGLRFNERRWTFSLTARTGVTYETMGADTAYGSATYDLSPSQLYVYLRADVEVCRRLDPLERLCLVASPNIYAYDQTFSGGMLSFRYELGK